MAKDGTEGGRGSRRKSALFSTPETLGQALYCLVHDSPQSVKAQAELLNLSSQFVYNIGNPNLEADGVAYPLKHLIPHTQLTQNFVVVDFIEQALGRVGIPLPAHEGAGEGAVTPMCVLALAKEFGDAVRALEQALANDGQVRGGEVVECRRELYELLQKGTELWARLHEEGR